MHRPFITRNAIVNALTIDVEDYYHVTGFESVIPRADWDGYESRVERNTHRLLDLLDTAQTRATFFVLGWVAERQPHLVRTIHARGHEVASHGYAHQRVYTQSPAQFRQETQRSLTAAGGPHRRACPWLSGGELFDHPGESVGSRHSRGRRLHL